MMNKKKLEALSRQLIDKGRLVEAGWMGFKIMATGSGVPESKLDDQVREAFFSGAHHLFTSLIVVMDSGEEPTEADLDRMESISVELEEFFEQFELKYSKPEGRA